MSLSKTLLICLGTCCFVFSNGQGLPNNRIVSWNEAGVDSFYQKAPARVVNVTTSPYSFDSNGTFDLSYQLQALLDDTTAFPGKTVFYFPKGKYLFRNQINMRSNRVLRGGGSDSTVLIFDVSAGDCIRIQGKAGLYKNLVSPVLKGSKHLVLEDSFSVRPSLIDVYQKNIDAQMRTLNPISWSQTWAEESVGMVAGLDSVGPHAKSIFLDRALRYNFSSDSGKGYIRVKPIYAVEGVGFEDFSIVGINAQMAHTFNFIYATKSWLCGIESAYTAKSHVHIESSTDISISGSYFHHSHGYGGGGAAYGVECAKHASNILTENCMFDSLRHAMMVHLGANGCVFAYNYSSNPIWPNQGRPVDVSVHGHFPYYNLFESNEVEGISCTDFWGPSGPGNLFFRNRLYNKDLLIQDRSHMQTTIANELLQPFQVKKDAGSSMLIEHANRELNVVTLDSSLSPNIPASYYLQNKPSFVGASLAWPIIGPEYAPLRHSIPAVLRSTTQTKTCLCSGKKSNTSLRRPQSVRPSLIGNPGNTGGIFLSGLEGSYTYTIYTSDGRLVQSDYGNERRLFIFKEKTTPAGLYLLALAYQEKVFKYKILLLP